MLKSSIPSTAASMESARTRMHLELVEVIAAARQTVARSRALLAEADAILAREKLPLIKPLLPSALFADEITP